MPEPADAAQKRLASIDMLNSGNPAPIAAGREQPAPAKPKRAAKR